MNLPVATLAGRTRLAPASLLIALLMLPFSANAEDSPAAPRFAILEFEIDGNTVLPVAAVERAVLPFLGENRQLADVEGARAALEQVYQQAGYLTVFVDVPEQRIDGGLVRLHVTEGRVERLRVTGSRYYDQGVIRERVEQLAVGNVPDFNAVQRQVAHYASHAGQLVQLAKIIRGPDFESLSIPRGQSRQFNQTMQNRK